MSVSPIGFNPGLPSLPGLTAIPQVPSGADSGMAGAAGVGDGGFAQMLTQGLERLEGLHDSSDNLAVKAATGDLQDIHDYTIASTKAGLATETTVAVRNKAIEAFTEIMRMQV